MNSKINTCFISASVGANLSVLSDELQKRAIDVVIPDQFEAGFLQASQAHQMWSNIDLVIGVITRERRSDWVLFELGQAWAQNKQILLIMPPRGIVLPIELRHLMTVRSGLVNREAIGFALDQLIAAPQRTTLPRRVPAISNGLGAQADHFIVRARQAISEGRGQDLEFVIADAIRASGVEIISSDKGERGPDFAIWDDELQPFLGNPVLVEIKTSIQKQSLRYISSKLAGQVFSSGTKWGLVIYGSASDANEALPSVVPNILAISTDALLQQLRHKSFADVIRQLRNERVHGARP